MDGDIDESRFWLDAIDRNKHRTSVGMTMDELKAFRDEVVAFVAQAENLVWRTPLLKAIIEEIEKLERQPKDVIALAQADGDDNNVWTRDDFTELCVHGAVKQALYKLVEYDK